MLAATIDAGTGTDRALANVTNRFENLHYVGTHLRCLAINLDVQILSMDTAVVKTCSPTETAKRVEQDSWTRTA